MADVSDPAIAEAYAEVRKDNSENDWLVIGYENNKKLKLVAKGSGGVNALADHIADDGCFFAYVRLVNKDEETTRTKFVFISFKGDKAPVMRKGNMSVHISSVKSIIRDFSIEISASDRDDISEEAVLKKLKASNY